MNIAVIPARGGSKRIPKKNIRDFCGRPMLEWPITTARESGIFTRIVVSTDDEEVAAVARGCGAEVLERPAHLADDFTPTLPVIQHAIDSLTASGLTADAICCLYATTPFVQADDLKTGRALIQKPGVTYSFAATRFSFPIQRAFYLDEKCGVHMFEPEHALTRSQDLPEAYHDAGQFYWATPQTWQTGGIMFTPNARPVILPSHRVQDIDTMEDWQRAELLARLLAET